MHATAGLIVNFYRTLLDRNSLDLDNWNKQCTLKLLSNALPHINDLRVAIQMMYVSGAA